MRIAAFGFRTIPPAKGAAGADKFAMELLPRLVKKGHSVVAYNRRYSDVYVDKSEFNGVKVRTIRTVDSKGFDTLIHSFLCCCHIIFRNTSDVVHIQNGGNSIWALPLRLMGKKVFISQDGADWKRKKWSWYGKLYLKFSALCSAYLPNEIIFDNIYAKKLFEEKFKKKFSFIPFGSEVEPTVGKSNILEVLGLKKDEYYLFVGRFIPDKGLHYLIPAFLKSHSKKKLVLIGGTPNPSDYEKKLRKIADERVVFAGFHYGTDVTHLMKNSYCYVQPSDVEGLSPVILQVIGLNVPIIVSDIKENLFIVEDHAVTFKKSDISSLTEKINFAEDNHAYMKNLAGAASRKILERFNWDKITDDHIEIFRRK